MITEGASQLSHAHLLDDSAPHRKADLCVLLASPLPPPYGGITNWTRVIMERLNEDDRVSVSVIDTSPRKIARERSLINDIRVQCRIWHDAWKMIKRAAAANKNCVLHICSSGGKGIFRDLVLIAFARKYSIPAVLHFHYGRIPEIIDSPSLGGKLLRRSLFLATSCIAMDQRTYMALKKSGLCDNTYLIPNPISKSVFRKPAKPDDQIVFVGHVEKLKGVEDLLTAWEDLADRSGDCVLKLIGPIQKEYRSYLLEKFHGAKIKFTGSLSHDETMDEISRSRCLVLPSYTEGFPNVILEAFALMVPVIATSVGAIPEMLSGNSGLMVDPGDTNGLSRAIDSILNGKTDVEVMIKKARLKVEQQYEVSAVEAELIKCWKLSL